MEPSYFLLIVPLTVALAALVAALDLLKRDFPSKNLKQLCAALIVFPPLLGTILYYFFIIRPNRYPRK